MEFIREGGQIKAAVIQKGDNPEIFEINSSDIELSLSFRFPTAKILRINSEKTFVDIAKKAYMLKKWFSNLESIEISDNNEEYHSKDGIVYSKNGKNLIFCPPKYPEKEVIVSDGVKIISENAFCGCSNIKRVVLSSSVELLENMSFACMENLEEIVFPKSKETEDFIVGEKAFYEDANLTTVKNSDTISRLSNMSFYDCCELKAISLLGLKEENSLGFVIPLGCFMFCQSLKKIILKENKPYVIGMQAFDSSGIEEWDFSFCKKILYRSFSKSKLKEINIGEETCLATSDIFSCCSNLKKVTIPGNNIQPRTFSNCYELEEVIFTSSKGEPSDMIGRGAFENCRKLKKVINISKEYSDSGAVGFYIISRDAFLNCEALEEFPFGEGLKHIDVQAFRNCKSLKEISFSKSLCHVGANAFWGCTNLLKVSFNTEKLKSIGEKAFNHCKKLKEVTINGFDELFSLYANVFADCKKIEKINIKNPQDKATFIVMCMKEDNEILKDLLRDEYFKLLFE